MASTVAPIVGAELGGSPAWAGAASAVYQAGGAAAAFVWGLLMDRIGRRNTLALGVSMGAVGAAVASRSINAHALLFFLIGVFGMGMANSALQLGRFVAAEVSPVAERARAISTVVVGGTVGAVLGPFLVGPAGTLARQFGLDELSGPSAISALLFLLVTALLLYGLRPEPRDLARDLAASQPSGLDGDVPRPLLEILRGRDARLAITALVFGQAVMVMLMVITSVHMKQHDHALPSIAVVISSHVFGMYAFSVVSGRMADRWGRQPVIAWGAAALGVACLWAPLSPQVLPLAGALFLLGLGWNFCYVAGSALLSDQLRPSERARTQGFNDFLIGLASAAGAVASGIVFAAIGFAVMGVFAAGASLVPLVMATRPARIDP